MNGFLFWERSISETNVKEILRLRSFCSRSYDNLNFTLAFELCSGQSAEQDGSRWILLPVYLWGIPAALGGWPHSRPGFWPFELRRGRRLRALCTDSLLPVHREGSSSSSCWWKHPSNPAAPNLRGSAPMPATRSGQSLLGWRMVSPPRKSQLLAPEFLLFP